MSEAIRKDELRVSAFADMVEDADAIATEANAPAKLMNAGPVPQRLHPTRLRRFEPNAYRTMLSDKELNGHGLKAMSYDAEKWLVPIDAPYLHEAPPCEAWIHTLRDRIVELRDIAAEEEVPFRAGSGEAALAFAARVHAGRRPGAFVVGNGNVRLVWENNRGEQVALQFLEDGAIQYILFAARGAAMRENFGTDEEDAVLGFVTAAGLRHLLNL